MPARATMVVSKILHGMPNPNFVSACKHIASPQSRRLRCMVRLTWPALASLLSFFADATAELPMRLTWINVFVLETKEDILLLRI